MSALAGCAALHTLDMSSAWSDGRVGAGGVRGAAHARDVCVHGVTDVSALAGCAALHTLDMLQCIGVEDVSALAGCAALHTLDMCGCVGVKDVSAVGGVPGAARRST